MSFSYRSYVSSNLKLLRKSLEFFENSSGIVLLIIKFHDSNEMIINLKIIEKLFQSE